MKKLQFFAFQGLVILSIVIGLSAVASGQQRTAKIRFMSNNLRDGDKFLFATYKYGYNLIDAFTSYDTVIVKNGIAEKRFNLGSKGDCYITFQPPMCCAPRGGMIYDFYYLKAGDDIICRENLTKTFDQITDNTCSFQGPGTRSFEVQWKIKHVPVNHFVNDSNVDSLIARARTDDNLFTVYHQILNKFRSRLSIPVYQQLLSDIYMHNMGNEINLYNHTFSVPKDTTKGFSPPTLGSTSGEFAQLLANVYRRFKTDLQGADIKNSGFYYSNLMNLYYVDSCLSKGQILNVNDCEDYIIHNFQGISREKLLVRLISRCVTSSNRYKGDLVSAVQTAQALVKTPDFKNYIESVANSNLPGTKLPDFALIDTNGNVRHLSDYKSKVVILDTWHTGCGACRLNAPIMHLVEKSFENNPNVVFISICNDPTKLYWQDGIKSQVYSSNKAINLLATNRDSLPFYKFIRYSGDPTILVIDREGKFFASPLFPSVDNGRDITSRINTALSK